ncbi:MAG: rod shape-determining protein MreD [Firmicutes bacterium]|nr:rod shape-determining protein MreD [Bacillota bacterium]
MKRAVIIVLTLLVSLIASATILTLPEIAPYAPLLIVIAVVHLALFQGRRYTLVCAVVFGVMQDVAYGDFIGQTALALFLVGYASTWVRSTVMGESRLLAILLSGVCSFGYLWISYLVSRLFGFAQVSPHTVFVQSAQSALIGMAFTLLFYGLYRKLFATPGRAAPIGADAIE